MHVDIISCWRSQRFFFFKFQEFKSPFKRWKSRKRALLDPHSKTDYSKLDIVAGIDVSANGNSVSIRIATQKGKECILRDKRIIVFDDPFIREFHGGFLEAGIVMSILEYAKKKCGFHPQVFIIPQSFTSFTHLFR